MPDPETTRPIRTGIDRAHIYVAYRGKRFDPPFATQQIVLPDGPPTARAAAIVVDRTGQELERFLPDLEATISGDPETAVLVRARRFQVELADAVDRAEIARAAVVPTSPPPPSPHQDRPVSVPRPAAEPATDYGTLATGVVAAVFAGIFAWGYYAQIQHESQLAPSEYFLVHEQPANPEPVFILSDGRLSDKAGLAEYQVHATRLATRCGIEITGTVPLWHLPPSGTLTPAEPRSPTGTRPPPTALEVQYRLPPETEEVRVQMGLPLSVAACAQVQKLAAVPSVPRDPTPDLRRQDMEQRLRTVAEAEVLYHRAHGRYGSAREIDISHFTLDRYDASLRTHADRSLTITLASQSLRCHFRLPAPGSHSPQPTPRCTR